MAAALFWKQQQQPNEDSHVRSSTTNPNNNRLVRVSSTRSMTGIDIEEAAPGHHHHHNHNETSHNNNNNNNMINTTNKSLPNKQPNKNKRRASLKPNDLVPSVEKSPASRGIPPGHLPLTINKQPHSPEPRLIHP